MTKRERKRDENLADNPPVTPDDDSLELALSVAELSSAATVKVYREREDGRKEFVVDLAPQPHLDSVIAKKCGPGRYQLRFFGKRSKERPTGYVTSTHVDIGDVPVDLEPDEPKRDRIDALLEGNVIGMFKQMNDVQEMQLRAMQRAIEPPARATNPLLDRVIEAVIPLALPKVIEFLFDRKQAVDPLAQTKELLELMKHQGREKTGLDELRAQMAFARELRDLTAPGESGGDDGGGQPVWVGLVERMADKAFDKFLAPKATSAVVPEETSAGALPAGSEDPTAGVMPDELSFLRELLPQLTQWANQQRPPAFVAQHLRFEIQPQYHAVVVAALQGSDVTAKLLRFVPALRPHAAWLEEVRGEVVKALGGVAESRAGTGIEGGESDDNGGSSRPKGNSRGQR